MRKYIYIFMSLALLGIAKSSHAFFGLGVDSFPMPDFADEAVSYIQSAADLANNVQKTVKTTEDNLNNLKTAAMSVYKGELSSLVDNYSVPPGQKEMETCMYLGKQYKNDSADNVYDLVKILFLQYPSNETLEQQQYDNYREEFYKDTVIEVFTAAGELQDYIENEVQPSIDKSIECVKGNMSSCGTYPPNGNNDAVFLEGKAFEAVDNLYQTLLKVTALKAQFIAAQAIYKNRPLPYVEGVENQTADTSAAAESVTTDSEESSPQEAETQTSAAALGKIYASSNLHRGEMLAFAQVGLTTQAESDVSVSLAEVESAVTLSNDKSQQYVDNAMTFVVPDVSPEKHAYIYEEDKMAELDKLEPIANLVNRARDAHNTIHGLSDYQAAAESIKEIREKYERALETLKTADRCASDYIGRHFADADQVWGASKDVTDYDSRKGISGWAYKAYETAKAAETTETSSGDVIALDLDYEYGSTEVPNPTDSEKTLSLIKAQGSVSPGKSKEEKAAEESRASQMLSWQVGAEASKLLASNSSDWGETLEETAFPIWQDVKSFYNQYLDKKYANIKSHLKSFSKSDVLAVVAERLKGGEATVDETLRRQEAQGLEEQLSAEMQTADNEGLQALSGYEASYKAGLETLLARRQALVSNMDGLSSQLKIDSDNLSDLKNKTQEDAASSMREKVTAKEAFPLSLEDAPSGDMSLPEIEEFEESSTSFSAKVSANKETSEIESLEQKIAAQKQEIAAKEEELNKLDEEIKVYKLKAQSGVSDVTASSSEAKASLLARAEETLAAANAEYEQDVKSNLLEILKGYPVNDEIGLPISPENIYAKLDSAAGNALETLYAQVDERVDQARKEISSLGDDLYNPANHEQIDKIHQRMIEDIKALAISVSVKGLPAVTGIELYAKVLSADTSAETEDYFVGYPAKSRDMKAPKVIFDQKLPPLREMFHFDETDFENVKPFVKGQTDTSTIINSEFLNVGGEIPQVWEYMLRPHAYVEADMDLDKALSVGCPQVSFFRGGTMPCRIKDSAIVVDMDSKGNYIRSTATGDLADCAYLEARSEGIYHTQRQVMIELKNSEEQPSPDCAYSELGTLFEADKSNKLRFRQSTYDAYYSLLAELNDAEKELTTQEKQKLASYDRSPMAFNQIGDFLAYAENERTLKTQLSDAEAQYDNLMEQLFDILREYGYEPSADLDLSKQADYNLVRNKLDEIKNQSISEAQSQIGAIDTLDNEVVLERVETFRKVISALQKDKDEATIISSAVEDQNNLDEEIKSSKVNEEVADKFIESLNAAAVDSSLAEMPYCATY